MEPNTIKPRRSLRQVARDVAGIILCHGDKTDATSYPFWVIVKKASFGQRVILSEGFWFSRDAAETELKNRSYDYGKTAHVYCLSGHRSSHVKRLYALAKEANSSNGANESEVPVHQLEGYQTMLGQAADALDMSGSPSWDEVIAFMRKCRASHDHWEAGSDPKLWKGGIDWAKGPDYSLKTMLEAKKAEIEVRLVDERGDLTYIDREYLAGKTDLIDEIIEELPS